MGTRAKPLITNWQGKNWRDVKGYEGIYEINELGQIRSYWKIGNRENKIVDYPTRYIKQSGYRPNKTSPMRATVMLYNGVTHKKYRTSRLMARAFLGMTEEQYNNRHYEVIHLNGDPMDCRLDNIKISNPSGRMINYIKNKNK